jgi:hypothetical protein
MFSPKFAIINKINNSLLEIERVRGGYSKYEGRPCHILIKEG